jgi:hypothetical protein
MLLWELVFERKPYEDMDFEKISEYVISGGREKIQFDKIDLALPGSSDTKIQKGFEEIIREGKSLFVQKINIFIYKVKNYLIFFFFY